MIQIEFVNSTEPKIASDNRQGKYVDSRLKEKNSRIMR